LKGILICVGSVFFKDDNLGRRSSCERRMYSYFAHAPERRILVERRSGIDRRCSMRIQGAQPRLDSVAMNELPKEKSN
jgi:hypothetical protein